MILDSEKLIKNLEGKKVWDEKNEKDRMFNAGVDMAIGQIRILEAEDTRTTRDMHVNSGDI